MTRTVLLVVMLAAALTAMVSAAETVEKTFTVREDVSVKINTVAGNITVIAWDRSDEVRVKAEIVGDYVQPEFEQGEGCSASTKSTIAPSMAITAPCISRCTCPAPPRSRATPFPATCPPTAWRAASS